MIMEVYKSFNTFKQNLFTTSQFPGSMIGNLKTCTPRCPFSVDIRIAFVFSVSVLSLGVSVKFWSLADDWI